MEDTTQTKNTPTEDGVRVKRTIKDTVFSNLFGNKSNLLKMYRVLHPEDEATTEDDLKDVTIGNILTDGIYNDLSFIVGNRLMVLVEAQSTWSVNIVIRTLLYFVQVLKDYLDDIEADLYHSAVVAVPRPEFYVIYTGERGTKPDRLLWSRDLFQGDPGDLELGVKALYGNGKDDIISQYVAFCKVFNQQRELYGLTKKALTETIRICKDGNVLKEYLESREKEVMNIMTLLFDQETVTLRREKRIGRENRAEGNMQGAIEMCREYGASFDEAVTKIARKFNLSRDDARAEVERYWNADITAPANCQNLELRSNFRRRPQ